MKKIPVILLAVLITAAALALAFRAMYVVPVIMYHSIDYDDKLTKLSVSPESFARQMEFLHKYRYNVVGLDKIASYLKKREKVPPRTLAITFDDGFYNNYKYAYPVLKKYNIPATIFVVIDNIGKPGWLGWKEIKEMSDSGLITIGSHTKSHPWLPDISENKAREEIADSKKILEEKLGRKADFFCYPVGAFDKKTQGIVKDSGYYCAVATNPGRFKPCDDIYAIKRVKISRTSDNLFVFWIETSGIYTWIKEHRDD